MATGVPIVIGFYPASQRPVDERYLNEGVPYADEAAVSAAIPIGSRNQYLTVNIAGVEYWFGADKTTLSIKTAATGQTAAETTIADAGDLFDATDVEAALAEVKAQADATDIAVAAIGTVGQVIYTIDLGAYSTVAARVAAATETTDYPTGWVLAANNVTNLLITHTLTGRKIAAVNVFEIDVSGERLLVPFNSAYTGILGNALTVLIEGLAPTALAIRIELIIK